MSFYSQDFESIFFISLIFLPNTLKTKCMALESNWLNHPWTWIDFITWKCKQNSHIFKNSQRIEAYHWLWYSQNDEAIEKGSTADIAFGKADSRCRYLQIAYNRLKSSNSRNYWMFIFTRKVVHIAKNGRRISWTYHEFCILPLKCSIMRIINHQSSKQFSC